MPNKFFPGGIAIPVATPICISHKRMNFGFAPRFLAGHSTGKKSYSEYVRGTARNCRIRKELKSRARNVSDEAGTGTARQICRIEKMGSPAAKNCRAPEDNGSVKERLKGNDPQFERSSLANGDHANATGYLRLSARSLW